MSELSATWARVSTLVAAVDSSLGKWLSETHGVGLTEYHSLNLLSGAPDKELRVNDLAQQVGLNQSSVTRLVGRLETKDLARRDLCPDDRRGVYAVITKRGEKLVAGARDAYEARVEELLTDAKAHRAESAELRRALHRIADLTTP